MLHKVSFGWVVDITWSFFQFKFAQSHNTKIKPLLPEKNSDQFCGFLASLILASFPCRVTRSWLSTIWGFRGHWWEAAAASFDPLEQQIASRLPLQTNRSAQTHREGGFWFMSHQRGHILWLKGRRVRLIFGDGWYLWQVILEGGSPLLHRSPPLPCLMDITRCPRRNLQFWFSPKQTSPDVKA